MSFTPAKKTLRPVLAAILAMAAVMAWTSTAKAHKVYLFAWTEGDTVYTESYFSKSRKVKAGTITVYDPGGRVLLKGQTDDKGLFSFKLPVGTGLRLVIEAGMGHRGEFLLEADETAETSPEMPQERPETIPVKPQKAADSGHTCPELIKKVVEEALDSRLKPLTRALAELKKEKGPGFTEFVGGLGYIFGIMGLVMYFRSRKNK